MKSQIKIGSILGYANIFLSLLVNFIYVPFLIGRLGQSEYGLYSLIISIISYLSVLDMGFGNAMIRFVSKTKAKKELENEKKINGMFLFLYIIIGIITLIVGIVLLLNIDMLFKVTLTPLELQKAKMMMAIMVISLALSFPLSIFDSYALACEKYIFLKGLAIVRTLIVPITMIPFLLSGFKSITLVLVTCSYTVIFHIICMIVCFKQEKMQIDFKLRHFDKGLFKEITFYSFYIFLNIIVDALFKNTDQVILGAVSGTIAVSVYAVASQITTINTNFSTAISGVFFPRITKLNEGKNADRDLSNIFNKVSKIQMYVMFLILFGFIVFGREFINLWTGPEYKDAYLIVLLIIAPSIIPLTQNIGIQILQAKNKHKFRSVVYILIAVLNVIASIPLAKLYGGIGAAIGTCVSILLGQILTMNIYYYKVIKIDIPKYFKNFFKIGIPVLILSVIYLFIIRNMTLNWITLFIHVIIYTIIYLNIIYRVLDRDEKKSVDNYIVKLIKKVIKNKKIKI